jgi:hypothetical protein
MPKLSALTAKAAPTTADEIIITDKADSNNTKRITVNNLPLSAAAVSALAAKAPTASPTFTGVISIPDGSAAAPSLANTGDSNTGLYWSAADELSIATAGTQRVVVDSSGRLGLGTSTPQAKLHILDKIKVSSSDQSSGEIIFGDGGSSAFNVGVARWNGASNVAGAGGMGYFAQGPSNTGGHFFYIGDGQAGATVEVMRVDTSRNFLVAKQSANINLVGTEIKPNGQVLSTTYDDATLFINRNNTDGDLVNFLQDATTEGSISVSGTTVSYNGGHLARWSRMLDGSKPENLLKGTVMTNLDEMIEWAYDETEEVLWEETDGLPEGVQIGDVKVEYKPAGVEDNEQLNHTAISSVEGDKDVAGVFIAWDDDDEYNDYHLAMVGDVIIRIAEGVEVKRGDLLISAGDGTAKPQDDDIIRSSTVAKVTSTVVSCTYDDGSFCVPCVLK